MFLQYRLLQYYHNFQLWFRSEIKSTHVIELNKNQRKYILGLPSPKNLQTNMVSYVYVQILPTDKIEKC